MLGVRWWDKQNEIALALVKHRRVFVKASHFVGKTYLSGGLVNWFFDLHRPGIALTTAPTAAQVDDALWKEVRLQCPRHLRPHLQPKASRIETAENHYAVGYTASSGTSFQGRHELNVLQVFDECVGVDGSFWDSGEGMFGGENAYWLAICNPTDTASRAYEEDQGGNWHTITVSALEHPNIAAELAGEPAPFPAAVRLAWLDERVRKWCTPIDASDRKAGDIEWPPGSGTWYRPGPLFESRVLGRWPSTGSTSVWSEAFWLAAMVQQPVPDKPLEIGVDVARFGDDFTTLIARRGPCVLHHETHNGWSTSQTAGGCKRLAKALVADGEDPKSVAIKIDDDGVGGGVTDQAEGFNFQPVSSASTAYDTEGYPNRRSELWFEVAERADRGELDLSRLDEESRSLLRRQAMHPTWKVDSGGRRVVEPKADTKKRLGRSPDDMDALNLAFAPAFVFEIISSRGR